MKLSGEAVIGEVIQQLDGGGEVVVHGIASLLISDLIITLKARAVKPQTLKNRVFSFVKITQI